MPLKLIPPRSGKTPYYAVRGTYLGVYVNRSTRCSKAGVAKQILKTWEYEIECGRFARPDEPTFASAALSYMNAGGERKYLEPLLHHFGNRKLRDIDQAAIDQAAAAIYPSASGATRNRHAYTPISAVMKHAGIEMTIRRPKGADGRKLSGWLWPEPMMQLLGAATELDVEFGILCKMLLYTGERLSEPLKLRCCDVRLQEAFAYVPDTKNGDPRPVFLPPYLVAELANHPRGIDRGEERLFRFHRGGHIYSLLYAAAARAQVTLPERQAFHIFCHTWATWMRRYAGLDTKGLVATQRWKDRKSADRYEHAIASEEAMRAALLPTPKSRKSRS